MSRGTFLSILHKGSRHSHFSELIFQLLRRKPIIVNPELTNLKRTLGTVQVAAMGIGSTIGTGIFVTLTENIPKAGPAIIFSFILASIAAGLSALCFAEIASSVPMAGSTYTYAYTVLGELVAVIIGACLALEYGVSSAAVSVGWSEYLNQLLVFSHLPNIPARLCHSPWELSGGIINLPAVILVLLCGILLIKGASESATVNMIMVAIKIGILMLFIGFGLFAFHVENLHPFMPHGLAGVSAGASGIFFSFIGLDAISAAGEEVIEPKKGIPRALILALIVIVSVYILTALAAVGSYPQSNFTTNPDVSLASILEDITGHGWAAVVFSVGAVVSIFSVTLVTMYGQSRVIYAMARDKIIPSQLCKLNPRTNNPDIAIYLTVGVVSILSGLGSIDSLSNMVSLGTLLAFIALAISVIALRIREPQIELGFKIPGYPITPLLTIAICIYVLSGLGASSWIAFGIWLSIVLGFYFLWGRHNSILETYHEHMQKEKTARLAATEESSL